MPNPYEPRVTVTPEQEVEGELDYLLRRLTALGATDDELDRLAAEWAEIPADERAHIISLDDEALARDLADARAEHEFATTTEDEAAAQEAEQAAAVLRGEVAERIEWSVAKIAEWVGDDAARAQAVIDAELETGEPRSTLIDRMERVARGA